MSDVDLWWKVEPPGATGENAYMAMGPVVLGEWIPEEVQQHLDLEYCEPMQRIVQLMRAGDQYVLLNSVDKAKALAWWYGDEPAGDQYVLLNSKINETWLYSLAVEAVLDPHVQLELGCLLLQRANADEPPLCEHTYAEDHNYVPSTWDPYTAIHDEVGSGPPSTHRTETIRLALRAYGNAWSYYKWGQFGSCHYLFRSLLALDGLRVCHSELDDHKSVWRLCSGLEPWLLDLRHRFGGDEEVDKFVAEVGKRFARTQGRLETIMIGRSKALKALEREFAWWDMVPVDVRDYLADADYMRSTLKDPTYNPKGIVATYCNAIEAMLQRRLGDVIDGYLKDAPSEEGERFKNEFLRHRKGDRVLKEWKCADLTINQFARNLRRPPFKSVLSKVGADAAFYFKELPQELSELLDHRNPASHAHKRLFTDEGVLQLRTRVLDIIGKLAKVRVILTSTRSNDD